MENTLSNTEGGGPTREMGGANVSWGGVTSGHCPTETSWPSMTDAELRCLFPELRNVLSYYDIEVIKRSIPRLTNAFKNYFTVELVTYYDQQASMMNASEMETFAGTCIEQWSELSLLQQHKYTVYPPMDYNEIYQ